MSKKLKKPGNFTLFTLFSQLVTGGLVAYETTKLIKLKERKEKLTVVDFIKTYKFSLISVGLSVGLAYRQQRVMTNLLQQANGLLAVAESHLDKKRGNKKDEPKIDLNTYEGIFIDDFSGREFYSNYNSIERATNMVNNKILNEGSTISVNDFYYELGLTEISIGNFYGINPEMNQGDIFDPEFTHEFKDGVPAVRVHLLRSYSDHFLM